MIIKNFKLFEQKIPLKSPFKTALRCVAELEAIILFIETEDNLVGYGSASPTAAITGETIPSIVCAIKNYIMPNIIGKEINSSLFKIISKSIAHNTTAKCTVEIALYDLLSKVEEKPLYK